MKNIGILTNFTSYDPSYSLNLVAEDQIKMLVAGGYKPIFIAEEGFKAEGAYLNENVIIEFVPHVTASNSGILPDTWKDEVEMLSRKYIEIIERHKINVMITHDIVSQPAALVPNLAARKAGEAHKSVKWLGWVHSVFSSNVESNVMEAAKIGRSPWPNGKIVFPNAYDRPRVARNFHVEEDDVLHVPHPIDIAGFYGFHPALAKMIDERGVLDKDVIIVYPCRLDRGKQPHFIIEIAAALKRFGSSVSFICCDFSSTGGDKVTYREEMKARAEELGLDETDVIFLSEAIEEFKYNAPRSVMMGLFSISNVFILPSKSETYSLVAQEAALAGNFLILNHDFFPIRSIYGEEPKYFRFSANIGLDGFDGSTDVQYAEPQKYWEDVARYIRWQVKNNRVLALKTKIRKTRSLRAVLRDHLEPIIFAD